jgi:DNA-binding XRE family transcriptional regulator
MAKRQGFWSAVVRVRKEKPDLTYKQIAKEVGCSHIYVQQICFEEGIGRGSRKTQWKADYLRLRALHPAWTANRIAEELGANRSTIYRLKERYEPEFEGVTKLGRAAMRAGLTVRQIEEMANARHA